MEFILSKFKIQRQSNSLRNNAIQDEIKTAKTVEITFESYNRNIPTKG